MRAARRALIAADRAVDVEVVLLGQIARSAAGDVHDPEVRLAVGTLRRPVMRADERDPLAVGRRSEGADAAVDARDARRLTAGPAGRIEVAVRGQVVSLLAAVGREIDLRAVGGPAMVAGPEFTRRDSRRLRQWACRIVNA